jgi:hypothetical protein
MSKIKRKRIRPKIGDILQIDLGDGTHSYAHVGDHVTIFYDYKDKEDLTAEEIVQLPIVFRVWVFDDVIRSGRWPRVCNFHTDVLLEDPFFYKQDMISGELAIYHTSYADTNYERPATLSEIEGLECAAVWDWGNVEERLHDHFGEKTGYWKSRFDIDISKVPESQKR